MKKLILEEEEGDISQAKSVMGEHEGTKNNHGGGKRPYDIEIEFFNKGAKVHREVVHCLFGEHKIEDREVRKRDREGNKGILTNKGAIPSRSVMASFFRRVDGLEDEAEKDGSPKKNKGIKIKKIKGCQPKKSLLAKQGNFSTTKKSFTIIKDDVIEAKFFIKMEKRDKKESVEKKGRKGKERKYMFYLNEVAKS